MLFVPSFTNSMWKTKNINTWKIIREIVWFWSKASGKLVSRIFCKRFDNKIPLFPQTVQYKCGHSSKYWDCLHKNYFVGFQKKPYYSQLPRHEFAYVHNVLHTNIKFNNLLPLHVRANWHFRQIFISRVFSIIHLPDAILLGNGKSNTIVIHIKFSVESTTKRNGIKDVNHKINA